jgi:hypothetical protein
MNGAVRRFESIICASPGVAPKFRKRHVERLQSLRKLFLLILTCTSRKPCCGDAAADIDENRKAVEKNSAVSAKANRAKDFFTLVPPR